MTPTSEQLKLYGVDVEYVIDKAKSDLGYTPKVNVADGLKFSAAWLDHHGILY